MTDVALRDYLERLIMELDRRYEQTAPLGGEYPGGFYGPPAHRYCRCTEGING